MSAKPIRRSALLALALLMAAAVPVRATTPPTFTVVDSIRAGVDASYGLSYSSSGVIGDDLYFSANDGVNGFELWRTNGTSTTRVKDINLGAGSSYPTAFTAFGSYLYFGADNGTDGFELWRTDGTEVGTTLVKDIYPGADSSSLGYFTALGEYLYFSADDGTNGYELWRTDGTTAGTTLVKDINVGSSNSSLSNLAAFGGYLYFSADDGTNGTELWRTNGTTAGTTLVKDINTSMDSYPAGFTAFGDYLYFQAKDDLNGYELWRTNGTVGGTTLVKDINPYSGDGYPYSSYPNQFIAFGDYLYFQADDGVTGGELWRTDGTAANTTRVANIQPTGGGYPHIFTVFSSLLYFTADDGTSGYELWRTNGTEVGTMRVADIVPGPDGGYPFSLTTLGDYLYFVASDGMRSVVHRTDGSVVERVPFPIDADQSVMCMCNPLTALGGRLFSSVYSEATGTEFAYLDEPTYRLPETNRTTGTSSAWTVALSTLALITLAVGVGLRRRSGAAQR